MIIPTISIHRMLPGLYGWQVFSEEEIMDEDYGDHSIEECLENAIGDIPPTIPLVEIVYCGYSMGAVSAHAVRLSAGITANRILQLHGDIARPI